MGCEIRASLAGFRSDSISLAGRRSLDNPDIGTIVLHRLAKVDGFTFSGTTAYAPKDARKAYEKGLEASKKEKWPVAEKELQKAVDLYPKYAVAWYELGRVNQMQGRLDEANKYYGESLKADGKYVNPYGELTRLAVAKQNWQEAVDYSEKLIKLNPYYSPDVYFFNAMAQYNLHHLKEAETSARTAIEMDKQHRNPRSYHLLGVVLARNQDLKGAAENMNLYLKFAPDSKEAPMVRQQLDEINKQLSPQAASAQQP
jgi:superkiller protein 3